MYIIPDRQGNPRQIYNHRDAVHTTVHILVALKHACFKSYGLDFRSGFDERRKGICGLGENQQDNMFEPSTRNTLEGDSAELACTAALILVRQSDNQT